MSNSLPYVPCPHCGLHLDHGEQCECQRAEAQAKMIDYPPKKAKEVIDASIAQVQDNLRRAAGQ